ncbi:hypothetical protein [Nocardia gipuzkoensis]
MARAKGRLQGRQPKLSAEQRTELRRIADVAELFGVSPPTVYRTLQQDRATQPQ